jgi:hypothetical protein
MPALQPTISFDEYAARMKPWVDRIVGRRAHCHDVCLDADDLRQDALLVLWMVHQKLADTKPTTDLCRIGTTAVVRKPSVFRRRLIGRTVSPAGVHAVVRDS